MARRGGSDTLAQAVHESVRAWILEGSYAPGARLAPAAIAKEVGSSTTVVREAMARLAADGFVQVEPNRGFFVPRLSLDELADLTAMRCRNEALAVELAVDRGDLVWESDVVGSLHRLASTPRRSTDDPGRITEAWSAAHRAFHRTIIAACGFEPLTTLCANLAAQTELYRRWAAASRTAKCRDVEAEHAEIAEAVLERDADRAAALLTTHYEHTVKVVIDAGLLPEAASLDGASARH